MKQLVFMLGATLMGTLGVYLVNPFWGVLVYYLFAVLRPQYLWKWSLPENISWSLYVGLATIGAAVLGIHGGKDAGHSAHGVRHRVNRGHLSVLAFALWVTVTALTARRTDVALFWLQEYIKIFAMYAAATFIVRKSSQLWALMIVAALCLAYISYEVNYGYLVNGYLGIQRDGYGGLDNNGAGLMLAMGVPLCWFAYESIRRWWRWAFVCLIPFIVHAVLMTYSRGAMLSLLVTCPYLVWRSRHRAQLGLVLTVFALLLIPVMAGPEISARFLTIQDNDVDESANSRRKAWAAAWQIATENPIFGVGVRNSPLLSFQYGADMEGRVIHSQYMQILADNGFVGLGLYLGMFACALSCLQRSRGAVAGASDRGAEQVNAIANGVECSLGLYAVGSIFLSLEVFELPYLLLLLAAQLEVVSQTHMAAEYPCDGTEAGIEGLDYQLSAERSP
jgi:probable O-glycosylation ligase (exosortase A-associated)